MNNPTKDQEILNQYAAENGWIPNPLKLMGKRPGTIEAFMAYKRHAFGEGPLTPREKALISLAATVALRAEHCIQNHVREAKKTGVTEDEIVQAMLITGAINGNSMLHTAYEAMASQMDK